MLKSKKNQKSNSQYRSYLEILILILSLTQSLSLRADETLPQVSSVDTVTKAEITQESSNSAVTSNTEIPAASVAVDATADNSFFMDYIYSGEPGKPYKSYSKFGFGSDGQFYGQKGNQLVSITIQNSLKVWSEDATGNKLIDLKATTNNFMDCLITNGDKAQKFCMLPNDKKPQAGNKTPNQPSRLPPECRIPDRADSYVLALSWQPGFCITKPDKPECKDQNFTSGDQPSAKNFSLHGLWPNQKICNQDYAFCGEETHKGSFVAYADLGLQAETKSYLETIMPSVKAGSGLERHEWHKHGSCQSLNVDEYFKLAGRYVDELNLLPFMNYIRENYKTDSDNHINSTTGKAEDATNVTANDIKKVDIEKLKELINSEKEGLGKDATNSLAIICKKHKNFKSNSEPFLVEMRFQLKAQLGKTLSDSINRAAKFRVEGCGTKEQNVPVNIVPYMQVMTPPQAH